MEQVYVIANPTFLSDQFIFKKLKYKTITGNINGYFYVKVNCDNKVEEIGFDLKRRLSAGCRNVIMKDVLKVAKEANDEQANIFNVFADDFWIGVYRREQGVRHNG